MGKGKFLTIMLLAMITNVLFAQNNLQDVVYLKNGSIIKGVVIEQVFGEHIKMETADGNIFVFKAEEIEKITKTEKIEPTKSASEQNQNQQVPKTTSITTGTKHTHSRGYVGIVETGYVVGVGDIEASRFKMDLINGCQFNPHLSLGLGVGVRIYENDEYGLPIYLDARFTFTEQKVTPYISLGGGVNLVKKDPHFSASTGVLWRTSDKLAVKLGIGYELQSVCVPEYSSTYQFWSSTSYDAGGIAFTLGVVF
ncbi:MAG: hypothetical protein ACK5IJ_11075 [Mangrovibacterium sp.]